MTARDETVTAEALALRLLTGREYLTSDEAARLLTELHRKWLDQAADEVVRVAFADDGPATKWNWWDAATIPASIADLLRSMADAATPTSKEQ